MKKFIFTVLLICIFTYSAFAFSGVLSGVVSSFQVFESYTTGQDSWVTVGYDAGIVMAQTFTPSLGHTIKTVKIYALRVGTSPNIKIDIYETSAGMPTGSPISTSGFVSAAGFDTNYSWQTIIVSPVSLSASTMYAIVLSAQAFSYWDYVQWGDDSTSPTYAGGTLVYSPNSGSTWTISSGDDLLFQERN
jgi:hypothetical protein